MVAFNGHSPTDNNTTLVLQNTAIWPRKVTKMNKISAAYALGQAMALEKIAYTPMSIEEYRRLEQEKADRGARRRTLASLGIGAGAGALYGGTKGMSLAEIDKIVSPRIREIIASGRPGLRGNLSSMGQLGLAGKDALAAGLSKNYGAARDVFRNSKGFMNTAKALGRTNLGKAGLVGLGTALGAKMLLGGTSGLLD